MIDVIAERTINTEWPIALPRENCWRLLFNIIVLITAILLLDFDGLIATARYFQYQPFKPVTDRRLLLQSTLT